MGPVSAEAKIDLPRAAVFGAIADLSVRSSFTDHFLEDFHLTRIDSSGVGAGARFRVRGPLGGFWMDTAIEELESPHRILEHGRGGRGNRVPVTTLWELTEGPGSLTTARVSFWTEPTNPIDRAREILAASSPAAGRGWREAMRRLREQLEEEAGSGERMLVAGGNRHATGIP